MTMMMMMMMMMMCMMIFIFFKINKKNSVILTILTMQTIQKTCTMQKTPSQMVLAAAGYSGNPGWIYHATPVPCLTL